MSIEDSVKRSPVIWFLSTLATGFLAGIGFYRACLELTQQVSVRKDVWTQCEIQSTEIAGLRAENSRLKGERESRLGPHTTEEQEPEKIVNPNSGTTVASNEPVSPVPNNEPKEVTRADQSSPPLREKAAVRSHVLDGTRVSLNACAREDEIIRCIFYVENKADMDRNTFRLFTSDNDAAMTSIIVDEVGREYRATEASFGSDSIRSVGYLHRGGLPSRTPIQGTLAFSGVPSDVSTIRLLRVTFGVDGFFAWNGLQHADFKNVVIAEEDTATP